MMMKLSVLVAVFVMVFGLGQATELTEFLELTTAAEGSCDTYKCPRHSRKRKNIACCKSMYSCECFPGYKRDVRKERCTKVTEPPIPSRPSPKPTVGRCPHGKLVRKKCCQGEPCWSARHVEESEVIDEEMLSEDEEAELLSIQDLMDEEETSSLRASVQEALDEEAADPDCPSFICPAGMKPRNRHKCPASISDCKCVRWKSGATYNPSKGRCEGGTKPPTPSREEPCNKNTAGCTRGEYARKRDGKCFCVCGRGYYKPKGADHCQRQQCYTQVRCE